MRPSLVPMLCCPLCRSSPLELTILSKDGDHIIDGRLDCRCGQRFWVVDGIPRMLGPELYQPPARFQAAGSGRGAELEQLTDLKKHTIENFGHQWTEWGRYGWSDGERPLDEERGVFEFKSLLKASDLAGRVVLDAGCGNGRYSFWAAQHAREVIAIDLGPAVESAYANLRHLPNIHIIQGDLFKVPIRSGALDAIFSIGVLMHTGDARAATEHLASLLGQGGSLTVHLYHRGNPIYEMNDRLLRIVTTRLSIDRLHSVAAHMTTLGQFLEKRRLLGYANTLLRLCAEETSNFDWYAAPIATHHTYPEVYDWFGHLGMKVVADNQASSIARRTESTLRSRVGRLLFRDWALTVRAVKQASS
jgi:SAM-dependent methyltransferase/uncharacterized protein YbaR (Trm112 family)